MSKKSTNLKQYMPHAERTVSNEDLVQALKERMYTLSELEQLGISELQVLELKWIGHKLMYQYEVGRKDFVYYIVDKGENPFTFIPLKQKKATLKLAEMSDIHIGSNEVDNQEIILLLTYLWESGYRVLSISGDLTDNVGVYSGQLQNLDLATADRQAETAVAILSLFDFHYVICSGNHDKSASKQGACDVLSLVQEKMVNKGKKFTYLPSYAGYLVFGDAAIEIIHMDGGRGNTMSETYASQRLMDAMFKSSMRVGDSNVNYVRVFNEMVPVVKIITGHYHALAKFVYGNVICESPLTTQHTTDFINRRGIRSKTGARVSTITVNDGKCVSDKGSIIFGADVEDIYATEIQYRNKNFGTKRKAKSQNATQVSFQDVDSDKVNKALKKLFKKGYMPFEEFGLTAEEIEYVNMQFNYNIYVENGIVVLKTDDSNSCIVHSPLPGNGIVEYMELSNLLVGSTFFNEQALRYMLDQAREQKVKHIHIGGNTIWGIPKKAEVPHTIIFDGRQQLMELAEILADYPEFHYYSVNGVREKSFIEATSEAQRFNPMMELSDILTNQGIQFTAINNNKVDFIVHGTVFRMINLLKNTKTPYTRDMEIINAQRNLMSKLGNQICINGTNYNIGAIFYSSIPNTQETHSGGIYVTSVGGPSYDPENISDIVQSNCECGIVRAYVLEGAIVKFERELIIPPV